MTAVMEQRPPVMLSAAAGDASSFSQLIEPLLDPAFRLAAVMLADRAAAEDAVQEASIKSWRKFRQLRGDERSLRSWFLSIVANECRMARRQRWWSVVRLAEPPRVPGTPLLAACDTASRGVIMIVIGIVLLIIGFLLHVPILWSLGILVLVIGAILFLLGTMGREVAGRRHYW